VGLGFSLGTRRAARDAARSAALGADSRGGDAVARAVRGLLIKANRGRRSALGQHWKQPADRVNVRVKPETGRRTSWYALSALGRYYCKSISRVRDAQDPFACESCVEGKIRKSTRFGRSIAQPINLGDFCNTICQKPTLRGSCCAWQNSNEIYAARFRRSRYTKKSATGASLDCIRALESMACDSSPSIISICRSNPSIRNFAKEPR